MTKFSRQNFKGKITAKVLQQELYSLLNSYTPQTMRAIELDNFNTTLQSISKDCKRLELTFTDEFLRIVEGLKNRDSSYVAPTL